MRKSRVFSPSQGTAHATPIYMLPSLSLPLHLPASAISFLLAFPFSGGGWQWAMAMDADGRH